jgi:serine/threonine protein kinase
LSITVGTHLGSYEITALLGKGGMGEVYRARDTKLKREVAIKVLPESIARDPDSIFTGQGCRISAAVMPRTASNATINPFQ